VHKRTAAEVRTDIGAGTVTSVAALTLGTSGTDLSSTVANGTTTPVITLNVPTASASNRGALSAADWTTFNNKQNALTNPVTGTGTSGQVAYFTGTTTISSESNLFWDATNNRLGIGTNNPSSQLLVVGDTGQLTGNYRYHAQFLQDQTTGRGIGLGFKSDEQLGFIFGESSGAASSIGFVTYSGSAWNERMRITSAGNLGIGTLSPNKNSVNRAVTVNASSGSSMYELCVGDTSVTTYLEFTGTNSSLINVANGFLRFGTDNTERIRIWGSSGNVNIGPTPASDAGFKLDVNGTGRFNDTTDIIANNSTAINLVLRGRALDSVGQMEFWNNAKSVRYGYIGADSTSIGFVTTQLIPLILGTNGIPRLTIANTGAATFSSSVTAGAFLTNASSGTGGQEAIRINNDNGYIGFFNGANNTRSGYIQGNTTDLTIATSLSTSIIFATANVPKVTITQNGNFLIGINTDAGFKLEVNSGSITNGGSSKPALAIRSGGTTYLDFYQGWNSSIAGQSILGTTLVSSDDLAFASAGTERLRIDLNGASIFRGSVATPHTTKSANYTLTATDFTVGFDCASNRTANLPDATTCAGRIYVIYQYNTNNGIRYVTLDGSGSQTIDGVTTYSLAFFEDFSSVMIQSNGSNWIVIADKLYPPIA
jgi:hypothetical protein